MANPTSTLKQVNYIRTMLDQASIETREAFGRSGAQLNGQTHRSVINRWTKRLEEELGFISSSKGRGSRGTGY